MDWPDGDILGFGRVLRVGDGYGGLKGFNVWRSVGGVEGDMVGRVPVFGGNLEGEREGEEGIDGWGDVSASGDGEGSGLLDCQ